MRNQTIKKEIDYRTNAKTNEGCAYCQSRFNTDCVTELCKMVQKKYKTDLVQDCKISRYKGICNYFKRR
jgi:hypothetical protein